MFAIKINGRVKMYWNKVLPNGNYDYDDMIAIIQEHKEELGLDLSDQDIAEIVHVTITSINHYMTKGFIERIITNEWLDN